jgi:bifunctional UDP-N-acetylglucosamine pyrophosphorylase/glucosamine-1-phosphate N-acetyltransferase
MDDVTVGYFFEGDDSLPFPVAAATDSPAAFALDRLERLNEFLGDRVVIDGKVAGGASITGPIYIGAGAEIQSGVDIVGPVYIGDGCSIRHGAQIRPGTILGKDCVVGHTAEIKNAVCMTGAKLQSGSFVGDAIVGRGGRIGSGVIMANRRFAQDTITLGGGEHKFPTETQFFGAVIGDNSRVGANATTAPGTLIGPYSWILPLTSAYGFIPRETRVMVRQDLSFAPNPMRALRSGRGEYEH